MASDYTGFETGGYDADGYSGDQAIFEHQRQTPTTTTTTNNVRLTTQINRRTSNISNDTSVIDSTSDIDKHSRKHIEEDILSTLKTAGNLIDSTEIVKDSFNQAKYSRLANASYDYFNSGGDANAVENGLSHTDYAHLGLKDFKVDKELSSIDNVVLFNEITGESHVSFRGTTDDLKRTGQFLSDWNVNRKIMFNPKAAENSPRFTEAGVLTDRVIAKYGKRFLTVSGHSQGGGISSLIAQEKDIRGFHFNPAISAKQVSNNANGIFAKNIEKQIIYKTHMDFASPLAFTKPIRQNFKVNLVGTRPGIDSSIVKTHSIDNFAAKGGLSVERNTMVASMKKSMGTGLNVAAQSYFLAEDIKGDLKNEKLASYKGADIGIDVAKNGVQFVGDNAIMDASFGLAPETLGLSVVVGIGSTFVFNMATDEVAAVSKEAIHSKAVKHIANSIANETVKDANKTKDAVVDSANYISKKANKVAHFTKHLFHW